MTLRAFAYRLALEQGRLEDALGELSRLLREGNDVAARRRLSRFRLRFERYVQGEERLLFPVLEAQGARPFVPTSRMRMEHGLLRRLVASLRDAINGGDRARSLRVLASLRSVFALHEAKEDWIIQPLLASLVTPATESAVIRWLAD